MHFPSIPARWRALPPNPCNGANSCKETGEVHGCLQGNGGSARRNERLAGLLTCTSPKSLHEIALLQENVRSARLPARNWSKCMAGVQPAARKRAKCTAGCRKRGEVHASVRARPFPYISPSSLHLEDFMQGYGGNVRQPAAKRGKCAENHVPRRLKNVHFRHISARVSPCAANAGNCTKNAVQAGLAGQMRAWKDLSGSQFRLVSGSSISIHGIEERR